MPRQYVQKLAISVSAFFYSLTLYPHSKSSQFAYSMSSLGSALIGVFDNPKCPKQALRGHTPLWEAPEHANEMDALGLRRADMYSYGLTLWQIMCNGDCLYSKLYWDSRRENVNPIPATIPSNHLDKKDFIGVKSRGDSLYSLAVDILRDRPRSDVNIKKVQRVLEITLRLNPAARATSFDEIANVLSSETSKDTSRYASRPQISLVVGAN